MTKKTHLIQKLEELSKSPNLDKIMSDYLQSSSSRKKLAQAMISPISKRRFPLFVCPVCQETCYSISEHALSKTDDEHKTLAILES
jgi:hypothetical protein